MFKRQTQVFRIPIELGAYGAETVKPVRLWSNLPHLADIKIPMSPEQRAAIREAQQQPGHEPPTVRYEDASGKQCYKGTKSLKRTQRVPQMLWSRVPGTLACASIP